jgi:acyl transferase domain-containing protein
VTAAEVRAWLVRRLADQLALSPDAIDVAQPLAWYGLGSAQVVALSGELEAFLGRRVSPTIVFEHPTIDALSRHLGGELVASPGEIGAPAAAEPIAIVGIGCRFPGASGPKAFIRFLADGGDAIGTVPADRFDADAFYDPDPAAPGKTVSKWGGFLDRIDAFDAAFFGIQSTEASSMDPQQRLLLEASWAALEDACVVPEHLAGGNAGVFIGISGNDYGELLDDPDRIDARAGTGNAMSIAANRISFTYDLRGPSMAIDTACSSSLVAVHQAVRSLRSGESTIALAGGVNVILSVRPYIALTKARILSPDGRSRSFDARANGYVRGEGAGVVVLEPLSRAVAAGRPIYAVIRGTAINQGGRSNGLMAPNPAAQEAVVTAAYRDAGVAACEVQYVEAHGTGTYLGDPVEAKALGAALSLGRKSSCAVGSVKTNIGHLEAAAGVAGLIKTALCLFHRTLVPSLHFEAPNPLIPFDELMLTVQTEREPWPDRRGGRLAGVSSFGFGGANAHVVLGEAPPGAANEAVSGPHVLILTAKSEALLPELAGAFAAELRAGRDLASVARTAAVGRTHHRHRAVVTGDGSEAIASELDLLASGTPGDRTFTAKAAKRPPRVAFVFSGERGAWPAMGTALLEAEPAARRAIDRVEEVLRGIAGWSVIDALSDPDPARLERSEVLGPSMFALQVGLAGLWRSWGVVPDAVAGEGIGAITAQHVAGALGVERALRAILGGPIRDPLPPAIPIVPLDRLAENGAELAIEIGPGANVSVPGVRVVPAMRSGDPLAPFASLALLVAHGCRADLSAIFPKQRGRLSSELPPYPFLRTRHWQSGLP